MSNPLRYIYNRVQENKINKLARKSGTTPANLPSFLNNHDIAALVLRALKRDKEMPALVFEWNPSGFNDVATAPGRNGAPNQNKAAIVTNLLANGATSYNDVVFTFRNGFAIGTWIEQINTNIPWALNQVGVPDVVISITRINRITERDTGTPPTAYDLEPCNKVFIHKF